MSSKEQKVTITGRLTKALSHSSCAILCSTIPKLPMSVPFFKNTEKHQFCVISVAVPPKALSLKIIPAALLQLGPLQPDCIIKNDQQIELLYEKPQSYTIDGEIYHTTSNSVTLTMGKTVKFLIP
jgi:diacylglycerol kinase family enzyme